MRCLCLPTAGEAHVHVNGEKIKISDKNSRAGKFATVPVNLKLRKGADNVITFGCDKRSESDRKPPSLFFLLFILAGHFFTMTFPAISTSLPSNDPETVGLVVSPIPCAALNLLRVDVTDIIIRFRSAFGGHRSD